MRFKEASSPSPGCLLDRLQENFTLTASPPDAQMCHRRRTVEAQEDPHVVGAVLDLALIPTPCLVSLCPQTVDSGSETSRRFIYLLSHLFSHYECDAVEHPGPVLDRRQPRQSQTHPCPQGR